MAARIQRKFGGRRNSRTCSREASLEPILKRREDLCKHSVYAHFLKTEIARSARGQKLQGPRAEDAMVQLYLVLKMLVT